MNLIIEQLQDDHKQLVRILYHLEREAKAYSGLVKADANLETILDILDYIQVYPEIWHHPTEDVIYEALLEKQVPVAADVEDLMEEHEVLELLTENLHEYINQMVNDVDGARGKLKARFIKSCSDYVNRQLRHMEREQKLLFPLIEQHFEQSDWDSVKQRLKGQQYLLEEPRLQEYKARYHTIANTSAVTAQ